MNVIPKTVHKYYLTRAVFSRNLKCAKKSWNIKSGTATWTVNWGNVLCDTESMQGNVQTIWLHWNTIWLCIKRNQPSEGLPVTVHGAAPWCHRFVQVLWKQLVFTLTFPNALEVIHWNSSFRWRSPFKAGPVACIQYEPLLSFSFAIIYSSSNKDQELASHVCVSICDRTYYFYYLHFDFSVRCWFCILVSGQTACQTEVVELRWRRGENISYCFHSHHF